MFHVKHWLSVASLVGVALIALLAAGCIRAASSSGWSAPVDAGSFILVSSDKGKLDAVDPETGDVLWRFPKCDSDTCTWLLPTEGARAGGAPEFPSLVAPLSADATTAELTGSGGIRSGRSVAIGDEIVGVFELQGNVATLVRGNPTAHAAGESVVPLNDDLPRSLEGIYADPVVAGEIIYVADYSGIVYALKERAPGQPGRAIWYRELGGNLIGDLALDEGTGTLFVPSSDGRLYALDSADGTDALPPFETGKRIWAGPVVVNGLVYVASGDGKLYALDTATGASSWTPFEAAGDLMTRPVISGGSLLIGSFDNSLYALDIATGTLRWSYAGDAWVWSQPLVADGTVYFADFDGRVQAVSLADGAVAWERPFDAAVAIRAGLVLVDDVLVAATTAGELWGIDPASGTPKWGPVLTNTSLEGNLTVVDATILASPSGCQEVGTAELARRVNYLMIDAATGDVEASLAGQDC